MDNAGKLKKTKSKQGSSKIDPSFKSKRYRDKLRTEVKALESLVPVDRPGLHRKLDSQTVYRLVIAFLRMKNYFKCVGLRENHSSNYAEGRTAVDVTVHTTANVTTDVTSDVTARCRQVEDELVKEINMTELIDGFILMLSVDGTIMYVSENIVHFNGFNQVDLIHRCIYGIVHPDDQNEVRNILEENGQYSYHNQMGPNNARKVHKMPFYDDNSASTSFFCRLKCFVGNTAGYMKLHCSGKLVTIENVPRSSKMSDRIAILFCQPFIYNGNDVTNEPKDKVFWSKHDLDLTFKETEHKITDILGYDETELCGVSMYQMIHAEDLFTLVNVHKSMIEVSDVQTFFIRFKHKEDKWIWLHSKGKVISKNSKKFSVVFTHCPLRDENSAFLQQEMLHRHKHGFNDLLGLSQHGCCYDNHVTETQDFCITERNYKTTSPYCANHIHTRKQMKKLRVESLEYESDYCEGGNDEVSVILNPMTFVPVTCPSTWHANTDRHSPVVPSSHVAHKLCLKEKQLQYAQFKRSQQPLRASQQYSDNKTQCNPQVFYNNDNGGYLRTITCQDRNADLYKQSLYLYNIGPVIQPQMSTAYVGQDVVNMQPFFQQYYTPVPYNYPPSPPPSPRRYATDTNTYPGVYHGIFQNDTVMENYNCLPVSNVPSKTLFQKTVQGEASYGKSNDKSYGVTYRERSNKQADSKQHYQSTANIKFSMVLNSPITNGNHFYNEKEHSYKMDGHHGQSVQYLNQSINRNNLPANQVKQEPNDSQSCSMRTGSQIIKPSHNCVHYDVEASIHMKIVESELKTKQSYNEVEIPTFDSFMDFLTDEKVM